MIKRVGRCDGLIISVLISRSSGQGLRFGQGHCIVVLDTFLSQYLSTQGDKMGTWC